MIALSVRVASEHAEQVLAALLELAPAGVEERGEADTVEYVIYADASQLPSEEQVRAAAGSALRGIARADVADDWSERWKQWHRPVDVIAGGRRVRIRPPWEPPLEGDGVDLVIDPGQAFGTGGHHTTRLCLELLLDLEPVGSLADWGCGTGVLALAAARLGWSPISAVDFDAAALEATRTNAAVNRVTSLSVDHADLAREPGPLAETVVANLIRPLLLQVAERMEVAPRRLILSGLLREEADEIAAAFAGHRLHEAARRESGEWAALLLVAAPGPSSSRR